jgi:hypothetical protein
LQQLTTSLFYIITSCDAVYIFRVVDESIFVIVDGIEALWSLFWIFFTQIKRLSTSGVIEVNEVV